jgi:hypothetical protein
VVLLAPLLDRPWDTNKGTGKSPSCYERYKRSQGTTVA